AVQEREVRRAARRGAPRHRPGQAGRAVPRGPARAGRRRPVGVRRPRDPDRRDVQAGAGLQAPPELRPPRGDDQPPLAHGVGSVARFLARRLLHLGPVLLGVSVVVFLVLHLAPGDPAEVMLVANANREALDRLRRELGLDQPLHLQYGHWIAHVARGDLGRSLWMKRPVLGEVLQRFEATLLLTGSALLLSTAGGIAL